MHRIAFFLFAAASLLPSCGPSRPNPGGPPACSAGGLGCICVASTCTCAGFERCTTTCGNDCATTCNGTSGCDAACGAGCTATCNGTESCTFAVGSGSEILCNGTGGCDVDCQGGDCRTTCNGTMGCLVRCPLGGCTTLCSLGAVTECADGVQVCGRDCPFTR